MKKITLLLAAGLLLATTGAADAQLYPPQACNPGALSVSDTTVVPGQQISVGGCGFAPNTRVEITFESVPQLLRSLLSLPTSSATSESFSTDVVIPSDAAPGDHTLKASGLAADGQGLLVLSTPVRVSDPDANASLGGGSTAAAGGGAGRASGSLARTGSSATVALLQVGLALLLAGAGLVAVMRRRRTGDRSGRAEPKVG